jgi:hypothetical protein
LHTREAQSVPTRQFKPAAHFGQVPPQSTSVSLPFRTLSVQLGAEQVTLHTPAKQSVAAPHFLPVPHFPQLGPPQSTSVS